MTGSGPRRNIFLQAISFERNKNSQEKIFHPIHLAFSYLNNVRHFQALNCVVSNFIYLFYGSRENQIEVFRYEFSCFFQ